MNRKLKWVVLMVVSLGVTAMAIDFMGPPTATLKKDQTKIAFTYHFSENDILVDNAGFPPLSTATIEHRLCYIFNCEKDKLKPE